MRLKPSLGDSTILHSPRTFVPETRREFGEAISLPDSGVSFGSLEKASVMTFRTSREPVHKVGTVATSAPRQFPHW
jgi:hypothetical protein